MPSPVLSDPHSPIVLTVAITRAYLSHNAMAARDLPALITGVHSALVGAGPTAAVEMRGDRPPRRRSSRRAS